MRGDLCTHALDDLLEGQTIVFPAADLRVLDKPALRRRQHVTEIPAGRVARPRSVFVHVPDFRPHRGHEFAVPELAEQFRRGTR